MNWIVPQYSTDEVDVAGQVIVSKRPQDSISLEDAYNIVNNWRSSHAFPLNTMQMNLRRKSEQVDSQSLVAQRIKRLPSIEDKLSRLKWLKLSKMQDIGGCRAIVRTAKHVERLLEAYSSSKFRHRLVKSDDYIKNPKKSGYRGHHLIYSYRSDRSTTYDDLKIEIQIRSSLQHVWATAVETVGTFTEQALKSSHGQHDWLRFFALMGSVFANREGRPIVPGTPENQSDLIGEIAYLARRLDVIDRLKAYQEALKGLTESRRTTDRYYLLELDIPGEEIRVFGFPTNAFDKASQAYLKSEERFRGEDGRDAVLVSVESLASLKRAYPNYFLDTARFRLEVQRALRAVRIRKGK